jgi:class 3 adenylate cyclase
VAADSTTSRPSHCIATRWKRRPLLHAFYCIAVDVVEQHGGVVENVVGDSVLAVWNAYSDCADHPLRALQAGKELLRATRSLLARPLDSADPPVVQPLALGVGIECGQAVVGSFGSPSRPHSPGEPVGVASRLQHMTQDLSMPLRSAAVGRSSRSRNRASVTTARGNDTPAVYAPAGGSTLFRASSCDRAPPHPAGRLR